MHLFDYISIDYRMIAPALLLCRPTFNFSSPRPHRPASSRLGLPRLVLSAGKSSYFGGKLTSSREEDVLSSNTLPADQLAGIPRESKDKTTRLTEQESVVDDDGLGAKLNSMSKWIGSVAICVFYLWRRDGEGMWVGGGAVVNYLLSVALKSILNQERPALASKSDPGMPSSHAQTLFYIVTYAILSTLKWQGEDVDQVSVILSTLFFASGSYLSWQRVSQKFHTPGQVVVGAIVGSTFSSLWYWVWSEFVHQAYVSSFWVRLPVVLGGIAYFVFVIGTIITSRPDDDKI